jgi:DNA polymerase-3 subunit gamma/tau
LIDHGFDLQTFFNGLIEHFRNLLIVKTSSNPDLLDETDNIKKRYLTQTGEFTEGQILRFLKILFESETRFKYSNNQNILLETILIELCRVNKEITDVANLIEDLENLKKKTTESISGDTDKPEINLPIKIAPADIKKVSNENCDVNDMIDHLGLEEFTHN